MDAAGEAAAHVRHPPHHRQPSWTEGSAAGWSDPLSEGRGSQSTSVKFLITGGLSSGKTSFAHALRALVEPGRAPIARGPVTPDAFCTRD